MWANLKAGYGGKSSSSNVTLVNRAFPKKNEIEETIAEQINDLELIFTKLQNVGQSINELMQVSILLVSIKEWSEYESKFANIWKIDEDKASWDTATIRMID